MFSEKATLEEPAPRSLPPLDGVRVPKESLQVPGLVVPYLNQPKVVAPRGTPEPFSVAVVPFRFVSVDV
jgi:hypothetical protein